MNLVQAREQLIWKRYLLREHLRKDWSDAAREAALRARQAKQNADDWLYEHPWTTAMLGWMGGGALRGYGQGKRMQEQARQSRQAWHPKMTEGWQANQAGKKATDNPHPPETVHAKHWAYGWKLAEQGRMRPLYQPAKLRLKL